MCSEGLLPVNAPDRTRALGRFQNLGFDEHLFGGRIQLLDYAINFQQFLFGCHHDKLAGARVRHDLTARRDSRPNDNRHIGRVAVFELIDFGDQRIGCGQVLDSDTGDFRFRIFLQAKAVVV